MRNPCPIIKLILNCFPFQLDVQTLMLLTEQILNHLRGKGFKSMIYVNTYALMIFIVFNNLNA